MSVGARSCATSTSGSSVSLFLEHGGAAGRRAGERLEHALDDLAHVGRAFAEVLVLDRVELPADLLELDRQRPFGVDQLGAHQVARRVGEQRVVEDHAVQVEEGAHFVGRARRDVVAQVVEFGAHGGERVVQPRDLVQHVAPLDVEWCTSSSVGASRCARPIAMPRATPMPCSFASHRLLRRATAGAVSRASPKRESISAPIASTAACASSPSASTVRTRALARGQHHHAHDRLRVHAPAVPGDVRSRTRTSTATCVICADGRACSPSLLLMVNSLRDHCPAA